MFYARTTIDALEGRTKKAEVIVLTPRAHGARRVRRMRCAKVLEFRPAGASARHRGSLCAVPKVYIPVGCGIPSWRGAGAVKPGLFT